MTPTQSALLAAIERYIAATEKSVWERNHVDGDYKPALADLRAIVAAAKAVAAEPAAGTGGGEAIHPLALAYLEAISRYVRGTSSEHYKPALVAWEESGMRVYATAQPRPAEAARICDANRAGWWCVLPAGHKRPHVDKQGDPWDCECHDSTVPAAPPPAAPSPEPTCCSVFGMNKCALRAGHDGDHLNLAGTVGWVPDPPEPTEREPAAEARGETAGRTKTISALLHERVEARVAGGSRVYGATIYDLCDVLDELMPVAAPATRSGEGVGDE